MLHAAILRSPVAHGLVAAGDASAALAIAGVRAVITAKDIGPVPRIPLRLLPEASNALDRSGTLTLAGTFHA